MSREELFQYIKQKYNTIPEYMWARTPNYGVFRQHSNHKWYGIIMDVPKRYLGINEEGIVDILNVKCDPDLIGSLLLQDGYLPAYHMNKKNWVSIILKIAEKQAIKQLIDLSYELTE